MARFLCSTCLGALALFVAGPLHANDELIKMSRDPNQWVMPTGDYANHRYSELKQITAQNVSSRPHGPSRPAFYAATKERHL